jgi:hypothetical protein
MIRETGDPDLFLELRIPRFTIRSWLHREIPDVVTCDSLSAEKTQLLAEMKELRHRAAVLGDRRSTGRDPSRIRAPAGPRETCSYLHNLDNTATLRRLIAFYVRAHNETMPHAAFNGQTPDEIYFGNGDAVVIDLAAARVRARQERMKANRMATCGVCAGGHDFGASRLQRAECGMF